MRLGITALVHAKLPHAVEGALPHLEKCSKAIPCTLSSFFEGVMTNELECIAIGVPKKDCLGIHVRKDLLM